MKKIYVKPSPIHPKCPADGLLTVRRESDGRPIPAEGAWMDKTPYIRRRLRDGDLVEAKPPAKAPKADTGQTKE